MQFRFGAASGTFVMLVAVAAVLGAAGPPAKGEAYRAEVGKWRAEREVRLRAEGGWLAVAGLFWLDEGRKTFGSDKASDFVLPASAPAKAGVFERAGASVRVLLEPGVAAQLNGRPLAGSAPMAPDTSGRPDVLGMGPLTMTVIERGERYGIRLRDRDNPARAAFTGLSWFDVDESWRIDARFVPYPEPKMVKIPNVLGQVNEMPSPGGVEFARDGRTIRLDGVIEEKGADELFFIIRDGTSGNETYGAGRFLYAPLPKDGRIVLDFNKAYSPPCAFTPYATCPLPPPQNRIPIRVEAGEKTYGHGH
jgi:uncharacterized protein (DUF1684 family)